MDRSSVFEGPVLPILMKLAGPIYIGMCIQVAFYITNTLWLSLIDRNSATYIGAMGMILPIAQILLAICNGLTVATSSIIARAIGEHDERRAETVAGSGFLMAAAISVTVIVLGYTFDTQVIGALGARGEYFDHALGYLRYILPGVLLLCMGSVFAGILQAHGQMKAVMLALAVGTAANMVLDPLLIRVLDLRLKGAALATVLSQFGIVAYYVRTASRRRLVHFGRLKKNFVDLGTVRSIAKLAAPVSFSQLAVAFSYLVYNRIIADIDLLVVTSFSLCARFDQIVMMPVSAISVALNTLVGQNVGRKNHERVRVIWRVALACACGVVLILATAMILFAPFLYGSLQKNTVVLGYAIRQTRIMEYGFLFSAVCMLAGAVFQGMGKARPIIVITFVQLFLVALPLIWTLKALYGLDMNVVWGSLLAGNFAAASVSLLWIRRRFGIGRHCPIPGPPVRACPETPERAPVG